MNGSQAIDGVYTNVTYFDMPTPDGHNIGLFLGYAKNTIFNVFFSPLLKYLSK
jgi:hypothetical protein